MLCVGGHVLRFRGAQIQETSSLSVGALGPQATSCPEDPHRDGISLSEEELGYSLRRARAVGGEGPSLTCELHPGCLSPSPGVSAQRGAAAACTGSAPAEKAPCWLACPGSPARIARE